MSICKEKTIPACFICHSTFTSKNVFNYRGVERKPLVITCGHSVCEVCLVKAVKSPGDSIKCGKCNVITVASDTYSEKKPHLEFPVNHFLLGLAIACSIKSDASQISFVRSKTSKPPSAKHVVCNECVEKRADIKCIQCSAPYCKHCFDRVHSSARAFRDHTKTDLDSSSDSEISVPTSCQMHSGVQLQFWCNDCNIAMCSRCLTELHNQHKISILSEKNKEVHRDLVEAHTKVINLQQRLKATKKKASSGLNEISSNEVLKAELEIIDHFSRLHGALLMRQNVLLKELYSPYNGAANSLNDIVHQMDQYLEEVSSVLNISRLIVNNPSYSEKTCYKEILERLHKCEDLPCHLITTEYQDTSRLIEDESIFNTISSHCSLDMSDSKAKYCLVPSSKLPENFVIDPVNEVKAETFLLPTNFESLYPVSAKSVSSLSGSTSSLNSSIRSLTEPPPTLNDPQEPQESSINNHNIDDLVPGCTVNVSLVYATSPSDFYVHRIGASKQLSEMEIKISKHFQFSKKGSDFIHVGGTYLVQYEVDKNWYRAKVISKHGNDYNVFYLDYGNSNIVTSDKFRTLPQSLINIHGLAVHCCLHECKPVGKEWDQQALVYMLQIIGGTVLTMTVRQKRSSILHVDLYKNDSLQGNINIQESLLFLGLAHMKTSDVNLKAAPPQPLKTIPSPLKQDIGDVLDVVVSHVESPSEIYVQNVKNFNSLLVLMKGLKEFYTKKKPERSFVFAPRKGMTVAAMFSGDNNWYRAIILDIPQNKLVTVKYVDFGNTETVSWKRIRCLAPKFFNTSEQCYKCSLADIKPLEGSEWSTKAIEFLNSIIIDQSASKMNLRLKAVIHSCKSSEYCIVLYKVDSLKTVSVNAFLVTRGVAASTGANSAILEFNNKMFDDFSESDGSSSHVSREFSIKSEESVDLSTSVESKSTVDDEKATAHVVQNSNDAACEKTTLHSSSRKRRVKVPVEVVRVISPSEFYISLNAIVDDIAVMNMELGLYYNKNHDSLKLTNIVPDTHCVVKIEKDGNWARGLIIEVTDDNSLVYLLDKGVNINISNNEIYKLDVKFMNVSDGVIRCHLGGVKKPFDDEKNWPLSSTVEFNEFIEKYSKNLYITALGEIIQGNKSMPVEVLLREEKDAGPWEPATIRWTSFNNYLRKIGLAMPDNTVEWDVEATYEEIKKQEPRNKSDITKGLPIKYAGLAMEPKEVAEALPHLPEKNEVLSVQHIDLLNNGNNYLSPQPPDVLSEVPLEMPSHWPPPVPFSKLEFISNITNVDDNCSLFIQDFISTVRSLSAISAELEAHCKRSLPTPHDLYWSVGQTCLCQYHNDKKWYRGVIKELNGNSVNALFVDYGNTEECDVKDLRKIPLAVETPIQGQFCFIKKIKPINTSGKWPIPDLDYIHSLVVEKHCLVVLEPLANNEGYHLNSVTLPDGSDLFEKLVQEGCAEYTEKVIRLSREQIISELSKPKNDSGSEADKDGENEDLVIESEISVVPTPLMNSDNKPIESSKIDENIQSIKIPMESSPIIVEKGVKSEEAINTSIESCGESSLTCYEIFDLCPSKPLFVMENCDVEPFVIPDHMSTFTVQVVFVSSSDNVVLQIVDPNDMLLDEDRKTFLTLMETMQVKAPTLPTIQEPSINMVCCALYKNAWYRAVIIKIMPNEMITVKYIDFGNVEVIPINEIREINEEWLDLRSQGIEAKLHNIVASDNPETMNALTYCLLEPCSAIIKEREPILTVELYRGVRLAYQDLIDQKLLILKD